MAYGYMGSYYSLDPKYNYGEVFRGKNYSIASGKIGATTSIQTANQLAEVESRLKEGMKTVEASIIKMDVLESIPKTHFKEMGQLARLAGAEVTVHAPIIDPSGFTQKGWNEQQREDAERQLMSALNKAHEINPKGNTVVTIHASAVPATFWRKTKEKGEDVEKKDMIVAVNQETGEISGMPQDKVIYPGMETLEIRTPEKRMEMANASRWDNTLLQIRDMKRHGDQLLQVVKRGEEEIVLPGGADPYYNEIDKMLTSIYDNAYKCGDEKVRNELKGISKYWVETQNNLNKQGQKAINASDEEKLKIVSSMTIEKQNFYNKVLEDFEHLGAPEKKGDHFGIQFYKPVEEFALGHASDTFSNLALKSYKQFKDSAPIISLENESPDTAFGRAEQLKTLVQESRKKFVEKAVNSGMREGEAEEIAEKMIGVTWDTGHINLMQRTGYNKKDVVKETEKIAPFVKHVHLNDNFGLEHMDLPPGMGEAPLEEIRAELEKKGFMGKSIVEGGNFVSQFKISPHPYALEALGSPIYSPVNSLDGPTWRDAKGMYGSANMGYGPIFPEQHFSMYGAGFSGLPSSVGAATPGKQSRFSGAPIE